MSRRVFVVRVFRPERGEVDHVRIRADDRDDAERMAQEMYPTGRIVRRHARP